MAPPTFRNIKNVPQTAPSVDSTPCYPLEDSNLRHPSLVSLPLALDLAATELLETHGIFKTNWSCCAYARGLRRWGLNEFKEMTNKKLRFRQIETQKYEASFALICCKLRPHMYAARPRTDRVCVVFGNDEGKVEVQGLAAIRRKERKFEASTFSASRYSLCGLWQQYSKNFEASSFLGPQ